VVSLTGYSYPWDYVDDDDAAHRLSSLNLDAVALAGAYHAARLATPLHPTRKITTVSRSALYAPIRDEVWAGRRLRPSAPEGWIGPGAFERAAEQLAQRDLAVLGWVALTHHDELGAANPDLVVRNAFGDRYSYALCPSQEEVREYCRTLCVETLRVALLSGLVLEACGPMGVEHAGIHDKTSMARLTDVARDLLSICFCAACRHEFDLSGVDVGELSQMVRDALETGAPTLDDALTHYADAVRTIQRCRATRLQREITVALRAENPATTVVLHASATPWAFGSFAASDADTLARVDVAVANCWGENEECQRELDSLAALSEHVGAYLRLDYEWERLESVLERARPLGVTELHLYHVGLLSHASALTARRVADYWRSS
jgi:hypothetical protein